MTDIIERLHAIRAHLRTGALGQREVWEEWLTEAGAEIERLQEEGTVELAKAMLENERLRAALQEIADMGTLQYAAKAVVTARRALEPKP